MVDVIFQISPPLRNDVLNELFASAWVNHRNTDFQRVLKQSLLYVCAYHDERLIGYVNMAWDGGIHGFLLDTTVHRDYQHQGIGVRLVQTAVNVARERGIEWVHVDYEPHLDGFYRQCGFQPTLAGLIGLKSG